MNKKQYLKQWVAENRAKIRAYRAKTKDATNARRRELYWQEEPRRIKARAQARKWASENKPRKKGQRIAKYGLTIHGLQEMLKSQNGKCAICGYSDLSNPFFFPMIDHCHKTNKNRGILCANCNFGIGSLKDSPELLRSAIAYLEKSSGLSGADSTPSKT